MFIPVIKGEIENGALYNWRLAVRNNNSLLKQQNLPSSILALQPNTVSTVYSTVLPLKNILSTLSSMIN